MREHMTGDEEYSDVSDEERSNDELITLLSQHYEEALLQKDQDRIDNEIAPRFWARFAPYYNEYQALYKDPEQHAHPDHEARYILDDSYLGKVQVDWMDQVLKGEIELGDEMDEDPSEY